MLGKLVENLVTTNNEAADDVLIEALKRGSDPEKALSLDALLRRKTTHGLAGVIEQMGSLPPGLQERVAGNVRMMHTAIRECIRSGKRDAATSAIKLIADGRQGKLTYLLTEAIHGSDESVARAGSEGLVSLARWVSKETRRLGCEDWTGQEEKKKAIYQHLMDERPEIEHAVARVIEVNRGRFSSELVKAALLLADSPNSLTFAILNIPKHGGQPTMIRRLQQPPDSEWVEAFLLAASHASVRSTFGMVFGHITEAGTLDALLARTHWLKDLHLQNCMKQVGRGVWHGGDLELERDFSRRDSRDVARACEWIAVSGLHDVVQDQKIIKGLKQIGDDFSSRLKVLRIAMTRKAGAAVDLLRAMLTDADERIARMAAREISRRKPPEHENILMQALGAGVSDSVRQVIGRSVGKAGFDLFWEKWDRLDKASRRTAGRAMLKLMPNGLSMLERRLRSGAIEQRLKAVSIAQELEAADALFPTLLRLCVDGNSMIRSKAVLLLGHVRESAPDSVLDRALSDEDSRVRANAIEVIEIRGRLDYIALLAQRSRSENNRERGNAIRALCRLNAGNSVQLVQGMLRDERPEHRISAMWAIRQVGLWSLLNDVGKLAREDSNMRVRRYAMNVLRSVAEELAEKKNKVG
jgi:HEAT repeat protein